MKAWFSLFIFFGSQSLLWPQSADVVKRQQTLPTVNISSSLVKRESATNLHIIDFHIINSDLYTLRNEINKPQVKYLCKNDSCFLVDKKVKIHHKDFNNQLIVMLKDSVYLLGKTSLEPIESLVNYEHFLEQLIGNSADYIYFKSTFFYQLIDEYLSYTLTNNEFNTLHLTHDSASFFFLAQHYKNINNKIFLRYTYPHLKADKYFLNTEKIKISKLNKDTGQLFKMLKGSPAFESMTNILEKSRSEGMLIGDIFYINDFNRYELLSIKNNQLLKCEKMKVDNFQYKNKFACDYSTHKSYFYVKTNYKYQLLEINLEMNTNTYLNFLENFKIVYHWEVANGRLYFLINNGNLEWQRILYSYTVDDPRLTIK